MRYRRNRDERKHRPKPAGGEGGDALKSLLAKTPKKDGGSGDDEASHTSDGLYSSYSSSSESSDDGRKRKRKRLRSILPDTAPAFVLAFVDYVEAQMTKKAVKDLLAVNPCVWSLSRGQILLDSHGLLVFLLRRFPIPASDIVDHEDVEGHMSQAVRTALDRWVNENNRDAKSNDLRFATQDAIRCFRVFAVGLSLMLTAADSEGTTGLHHPHHVWVVIHDAMVSYDTKIRSLVTQACLPQGQRQRALEETRSQQLVLNVPNHLRSSVKRKHTK